MTYHRIQFEIMVLRNLVFLFSLVICGGKIMAAEKEIAAAQVELEARVIDLPGVIGVGQGVCDGAPCLSVYVESSDSSVVAQIPAQIKGIEVKMEFSGPIQIQPK